MNWNIGGPVLGTLGAALLMLLGQLLNGKAFRKILFMPIEWWVRRSQNKTDDVLLQQAERDIGIDSVKLPEDISVGSSNEEPK